MSFLTRTDPTRNINRFYIIAVTPTLFGDWAVMRAYSDDVGRAFRLMSAGHSD
jgi:predicted DNA-binding WGR domain protein